MAYDFRKNEKENNKILYEIKSYLNSSSSNILEVERINEITNNLWNNTDKNKDRCIAIINKLSNKIKKAEDFKIKSTEFLNKLTNEIYADEKEDNKGNFNSNINLKNKPKLSNFNATNETIQELESFSKQFKKPKINNNIYYLIPIITFLLVTLFWKHEGHFEFSMVLIGGFFAFLVQFLVIWIIENNNKPTVLEKESIAKIEEKIKKRSMYEKALYKWEYTNLVTNKGYWLNKKGIPLENSVKTFLESKGWVAQTTNVVGDGGIDIICSKENKKVFIQCKGYSKPLGVSSIRDAAGVKMAHNPDEMIVIAPNGFTKGSIEFAKQSDVLLIDAFWLTLIAENKKDLI